MNIRIKGLNPVIENRRTERFDPDVWHQCADPPPPLKILCSDLCLHWITGLHWHCRYVFYTLINIVNEPCWLYFYTRYVCLFQDEVRCSSVHPLSDSLCCSETEKHSETRAGRQEWRSAVTRLRQISIFGDFLLFLHLILMGNI